MEADFFSKRKILLISKMGPGIMREHPAQCAARDYKSI